jgi:hypothetical protein
MLVKILLCQGKRSGKKGQLSLLDVPDFDNESLTSTRSAHRPRVSFCWCDFICPLCFVATINRTGWIFAWNLSLYPIYHHWLPAFSQLSQFFFFILKKRGARCKQFSSVTEGNGIRKGSSLIFHLPRHSCTSLLKWEWQYSNVCAGRCCTNGSRYQFSLSPMIAAQLTPSSSRFYC